MFFFRRGKTRHGLAIDCGTASVRGMVFSYEEQRSPSFTAENVIRFSFPAGTHINAAILRRHVGEGLRAVLSKLPHHFRPDEIIISVPSPFYISRMNRYAVVRKNKNPFTKQELSSLLETQTASFHKEVKKHIAGEPTVFSTRILKTQVNGYDVPSVIGARGKQIEFFIRHEGTSRDVASLFTEHIKQQWPETATRIVSSSSTNIHTAGRLFDAESGFFLFDIGGEVTDVTLLTRGTLELFATVPMGNNVLVRQIAEQCRCNIRDAQFSLRRLAENTLDQKEAKRLEPILQQFKSQWWKETQQTILAKTPVDKTYSHAVLTGGGAVVPVYRSALEKFVPHISVAVPALLEHAYQKNSFSGPSDFTLASLPLLSLYAMIQ